MHAALSLILTLFGVAVLFVAQDAQFLAAVQVIVYAGAIVVLFLFVIMLLGVDKAEDLRVEPFKMQRQLAAIVGGGVIGLVDRSRRSRRATTSASSAGDQRRGRRTSTAGAHDSNIRAWPATCSATTCSPSSSPRCCW